LTSPGTAETKATLAARLRRLLAWLWLGPGLPALILFPGLAAVQVIGSHFAGENQPDREQLDFLGYGLLVLGPALLLARLRFPGAVALAVSAVTLAYVLLDYPFGPFVLSVIVALFTAVDQGRRLAAWSSALLLYAGHFGARYAFGIEPEPKAAELLGVGAWLLVVLAASEVVRARRQWTAESRRAEEQETGRRASEERLRIARELHDVLGHHLSLINVQAGVALHLKDRQPEQAATALTAIEQASREALSELKSVINILQQPQEAAPRAPLPGLAGLENLARQARAAGLAVDARVDGDPRPLPAPVDAAAYRIVQEALTNVVRHSGARRVSVALRYGDQELEVAVEDNGPGPRSGGGGGGSGIEGMRERVSALGGRFEAGPLPGQGFRVRAVLPLGQAT